MTPTLSVDADHARLADVAVMFDALGVPGAVGAEVSGAGGVEVPAFSAGQIASHASAEFQLMATSFTENAPMSSMKHFCALHPASCAWATGSWISLFGPPENAPGGAIGSDPSSWLDQKRWCTLRTGLSPYPAMYD